MTAITLPDCIHATRIGCHSECEHDEFGELAPITWLCACGSRLKLEHYVVIESEHFGDYIGDKWYPEIVSEGYRPVSDERKAEFLAAHQSCKLVCFKCGIAPVDFFQGWCDECQEKAG